jgi:glycosyltransferase involved in cell wall biosynthesis
MYASRFSEIPKSRWAVIPNGFDEQSFDEAQSMINGKRFGGGRTVLLHSGVLYQHARDPRCFFEALAQLCASGDISASTLKVVLRGSGDESIYRSYLKELKLEEIVSLEEIIPYKEALAEMLRTDGLLIFQASNCNWQIPAKVYEYLRARRPILAFTDPSGDTATLLRSEGIHTVLPIDSVEKITEGLRDFLRTLRQGSAPLPSAASVERHSRRARTRELATVLNSL